MKKRNQSGRTERIPNIEWEVDNKCVLCVLIKIEF